MATDLFEHNMARLNILDNAEASHSIAMKALMRMKQDGRQCLRGRFSSNAAATPCV